VGGTVRVQVHPLDENEMRYVSITIIDSGIGIKADFLPKLFERFSQADSSSIRLHGGLGLGLALVRDLTQLHGGIVRAESEGVNKGAAFTVLLPVKAKSVGEKAGILTNEKFAEETQRPDLSDLCVMVVEDDPSTMETLCETLRSFGAKTIACATVPQALSEFAKEKPDVLVSDIAMPGSDGYCLIRKIREFSPQKNGDIPALALTAYATEGDIKLAMAAGFNFHMSKPFDTFRLGRAVAKIAKKGKV
jgi:CheY-like chemotaxis protein